MRHMWLGVAVLVGAIGIGVWWTMRTGSRERTARLADRGDLASEVIYSQFLEKDHLPGDLALQLWNEIASSLGVPPEKLRPTDRFDKELAPVEEWDDDIVELEFAADRRLKRTHATADFSTVKSVADYVRFFCQLEKSNHTSGIRSNS